MKKFESIASLIKACQSGEVKDKEKVYLKCYVITKKIHSTFMTFDAIDRTGNYYLHLVHAQDDCKMDYNLIKNTRLNKTCAVSGEVKIMQGGVMMYVSSVDRCDK